MKFDELSKFCPYFNDLMIGIPDIQSLRIVYVLTSSKLWDTWRLPCFLPWSIVVKFIMMILLRFYFTLDLTYRPSVT